MDLLVKEKNPHVWGFFVPSEKSDFVISTHIHFNSKNNHLPSSSSLRFSNWMGLIRNLAEYCLPVFEFFYTY